MRTIGALCGLTLTAGLAIGQDQLANGVFRAPSDRAPVLAPEFTVPFVDDLFDPTMVPTAVFGALDLKPIAAEDQINDTMPGTPVRIGVDRALPNGAVSATTHGEWRVGGDGTRVWNLRLVAPDAKLLRVRFSEFSLPEGGVLLVRGKDLNAPEMYEKLGPNNDGSFWSVPSEGEFVELQYIAPGVDAPAPNIVIDQISHVYRTKPLQQLVDGALQTRVDLPCHEDVMCHTVDTNARDSVGAMIWTFGGTFVCSGALLSDNDPNTVAGWFLTANHCISQQGAVNSLTVYWFYQKIGCGGVTPSLGSRPRSDGGTLLWTSSTNDSTFIRLANDPQDGQGLAAWTTGPLASNSQVFGIHHPNFEFKRFSEGRTTFASPVCLPQTQYWYLDWIVTGATEGGSSGSPLFNPSWELVGQLFGSCGSTNCTNFSTTNVVYGKFDKTYPNISSWLENPATDDIYEDNDTLATPAALTPGTHALHLVDFDDYFTFTVDCERLVTIEATFLTSDMDLDMNLHDSGGAVIGASLSNTGTETISQTLQAGTYTINTTKDSGWGGPYTLSIDVGEPCFDDCNNNGIDDLIDIAMGDEEDCNSNMVPDTCDINPPAFTDGSGMVSPFGFAANINHTLVAPPQAVSDVTISFTGSGDFEAADETAFLLVNGVFVDTMLGSLNNCAATPDTDQFVMTQADWNNAITAGGGDVQLELIPSGTIDSTDCGNGTWGELTASYSVQATSMDVDMNGIPDECSLGCSPADVTTTGAGAGDPGFGVPDGQITSADLNFFVNAFVASDASIADVTTTGAGAGDPGFGVPDGNVTAADLNYFVNLWVAGCP